MNSRPSADHGGSAGQAQSTRIAAVLSTTGGTGCTSIVANLAWMLASAGRSVLVLDRGSEPPYVREYLEPFYVDDTRIPDELGDALLAGYGPGLASDVSRPVAEGFLPPESSGHIDVITLTETNGEMTTDFTVGDQRAMAELRTQLVSSGYDNVLIDAPTGSADDVLTMIAVVCDLAAVCFRPRPQVITASADVAKQLRRLAPVRIDLLPVVTMFHGEHEPRAENIRATIRTAFADVLADEGQSRRIPDIRPVEIPYRHHDAFDPLLALLAEDPGSDGTLDAQYGRLADAVTLGAVTSTALVSKELRVRYGTVFGLEPPAGQDRVLIAYAPPDRPWADWVEDKLSRAGVRSSALLAGQPWLESGHSPDIVVIDTPHFADSAARSALDDIVRAAEARGNQVNVARLPVFDGRESARVGGADHWDDDSHAEQAEQRLRTTLYASLGLIGPRSAEQAAGMRLPGRIPGVFRLPPRDQRFVGRDEELEDLRDRVTNAEGTAVITLGGESGIGKSSLALEYAHRFAGAYAVVWWISAGDRQSALVALAELAGKLRPEENAEFGTTAALNQLTKSSGRYLLVYDNADDPDVLEGLLPGGDGHILITSNAASAPALGLTRMSSEDSTRLLTSRIPGLSIEDAERVAQRLKHLPLALELSAAWLAEAAVAERATGTSVDDSALWAVRALLERLEATRERVPETTRQATARVVGLVTATLEDRDIGRLAVKLAQLCVFLSPYGVGLDLIRSRAMIDRLVADAGSDADVLRLDYGELDRVLWIGARYGLFRVDWGERRSLVVHRVVLAALRDVMTPAEVNRSRAVVHDVLAAFAPTEVDSREPYYQTRFTELRKHVFPSGAVDSDDDAVRRWLVNQVRFEYATGGSGVHRATIGPATALLDTWTQRHSATDSLRCRLAAHLASIHRALGAPAEALRLDDSALGQQRRSLPDAHPQSLLSARGRGGDLRALGLFTEALYEDQVTWDGFRRELGEDHEHTRMAANNLALSLFLSGDVREALDIETDNFRRRMRLFGADDPNTWWSLARVGLYRCELGEYDLAWKALLTTVQRLWPPENPDNRRAELAVRWYQAIVLRRRGDGQAAEKRTRSLLPDYRTLEGEHHPDTLACTLSLAAARRMVGDDPPLTVELAKAALHGYLDRVRLIEVHPFVALARVGVGLASHAAGGTAEALEQIDLGRDALRERLGEAHPWSLAADVNYARVTGDASEVQAARDNCVRFLGSAHPHTKIAEGNLQAARTEGGDQQWREIDVDIPQT